MLTLQTSWMVAVDVDNRMARGSRPLVQVEEQSEEGSRGPG